MVNSGAQQKEKSRRPIQVQCSILKYYRYISNAHTDQDVDGSVIYAYLEIK